MKAIILAAGKGERLDAEKNKCMMMVAGRPLIEFSMMNAKLAGCKEIILVVGHRAGDIVNRYGLEAMGIPVYYVFQQEQRGILHALKLCMEHVGGSSVLVMFGDEVIFRPRHAQMMQVAKKFDVLVGVVEVRDTERICETYTIGSCARTIYRLIEKPTVPFNSWMGTGNCFFKNEVFRKLNGLSDELFDMDYVDFIQVLVDLGHTVSRYRIGDDYENINMKENLDRLKSRISSMEIEKWVK